MLKLIVTIVVSLLIFFACGHKEKEHSVASQTDSIGLVKQIESFPKMVEIGDYGDWLKSQIGVFYDFSDSLDFLIGITYFPLKYEAALSSYLENQKVIDLPRYINIKKGFQYFRVECTTKISGYESKTRKDRLYNELRRSLYFVTNSKDTITNYTTEFFPSSVMDQPSTMIILIPDKSIRGSIQAVFMGKSFQVKDLKIEITPEAIRKLPEIKI